MASDAIWLKTHCLENLPGKQVTEVHCPLRFPDTGAHLIWTLPCYFSKCWGLAQTSQLIKLRKNDLSFWGFVREPLEHARVL